eukprot:COSAG01_NODE_5060_length_4518_cov_47.000000_3_plen_107_part_00
MPLSLQLKLLLLHRSTIADVVMVVGALASVVIPIVFVLHSRRAHRDWYTAPREDAKGVTDGGLTVNPLNVGDESAPQPEPELGPANTSEESAGVESEAENVTQEAV